MRVAFLGSGAFGLPTLERIRIEQVLAGVITQPDRPAGRARRMTPTPVGAWRDQQAPETPILKPEDVNDAASIAWAHALGADAWVVIAFGQKLGRALLGDRFVVNLHASLLPRWRGAAPINWAILAGDAETGNSVITIAERMDAGLVLGRSRRAIAPETTAGELHDALAQDGPDLVMSVLDAHDRGLVEAEGQDESLVTRARKLSKFDGWVDFTESAEACRRRVHGLTPWPGVRARLNDTALKLLRVKAEDASAEQAEPGTLIDADEGVVACAKGRLTLLEVQPAGKRTMAWRDFARGHAARCGDRLIGGRPC